MKNNMGGGSYSYNTSVARADAVYKSMGRSEVFTSTSLNPQMDIKNKGSRTPYSFATSTQEAFGSNSSSSLIVSSIALLLLPTAGNTVSKRFND